MCHSLSLSSRLVRFCNKLEENPLQQKYTMDLLIEKQRVMMLNINMPHAKQGTRRYRGKKQERLLNASQYHRRSIHMVQNQGPIHVLSNLHLHER